MNLDTPAVVLASCPGLLRWRNELAAGLGLHGAALVGSAGEQSEGIGSILPGDSVRQVVIGRAVSCRHAQTTQKHRF